MSAPVSVRGSSSQPAGGGRKELPRRHSSSSLPNTAEKCTAVRTDAPTPPPRPVVVRAPAILHGETPRTTNSNLLHEIEVDRTASASARRSLFLCPPSRCGPHFTPSLWASLRTYLLSTHGRGVRTWALSGSAEAEFCSVRPCLLPLPGLLQLLTCDAENLDDSSVQVGYQTGSAK